jgi:hypothetical protein
LWTSDCRTNAAILIRHVTISRRVSGSRATWTPRPFPKRVELLIRKLHSPPALKTRRVDNNRISYIPRHQTCIGIIYIVLKNGEGAFPSA